MKPVAATKADCFLVLPLPGTTWCLCEIKYLSIPAGGSTVYFQIVQQTFRGGRPLYKDPDALCWLLGSHSLWDTDYLYFILSLNASHKEHQRCCLTDIMSTQTLWPQQLRGSVMAWIHLRLRSCETCSWTDSNRILQNLTFCVDKVWFWFKMTRLESACWQFACDSMQGIQGPCSV